MSADTDLKFSAREMKAHWRRGRQDGFVSGMCIGFSIAAFVYVVLNAPPWYAAFTLAIMAFGAWYGNRD